MITTAEDGFPIIITNTQRQKGTIECDTLEPYLA